MSKGSALVLFSGGQDSSVCLAWALDNYDVVETVGFAYGQRHEVELIARQDVLAGIRERFSAWDQRLGADHTLDIAELGAMSETALTREAAFEVADDGLPSTFVPGRNLLFFVYAAALGYRRGITTLIGGMCETDFSGYPDCRNDALQAQAEALTLGMGRAFEIITPLMWRDKAATWQMAEDLGGSALVELIVAKSVSCYRGNVTDAHAWGYGCSDCPACDLRRKGWQTWQQRKSDRAT